MRGLVAQITEYFNWLKKSFYLLIQCLDRYPLCYIMYSKLSHHVIYLASNYYKVDNKARSRQLYTKLR